MRRILTFGCEGDTLVGTLDDAPGATGVLVVSGGNEIRIGAHRGMALLGARLAEAGTPCFRYDRRGIGDSGGINGGFDQSSEDIAAAAAAFRREAGVSRVIALGNCDAASALALFHAAAGIDAVILSNPWTGATRDHGMPPPAAIRARYLARVKSPAEWLRLLRGGVDLRKLFKGVKRLAASRHEEGGLVAHMAASLRASGVATTILLAEQDNAALAFRHAWRSVELPAARTHLCATASHSFASAADKAWLFAQVLAVAQSDTRESSESV